MPGKKLPGQIILRIKYHRGRNKPLQEHCKHPVFLAVKIENLFAATVALFGAENRTLKQNVFERPGKNLQISYSFDYVKCA